MTDAKDRAAEEAKRLEKKYGRKTGAVGSAEFKLKVVPTGSLALDYALGTGGWPLGHPVEVYGAPDIGKSSVIGLNAIRNAQAMGLLCGIIAMEPGFDPLWAERNGVDPDRVIIARPDHGEDAFEILQEWIQDDIVDFTVFDSIGAVIAERDREEGAKARVGGQSGLISEGVARILSPCWKNDKGLIFLNQQRDEMNSHIPGIKKSPGGNALHHGASIRIQLKQKGSAYKARFDGEEVEIGRTLVCIQVRNKHTEGTKIKAEFDYYNLETEDHALGIDVGKDVVNTGIRSRVIVKAGGYYRHRSFPTDKHQIQGKEAVFEYLLENPKAIEMVRQDVIGAMIEKVGAPKSIKPELEVVDGAQGD